MPPFWLDHALALVLAVFFPLRAATFGYRRLVLAPPEQVAATRRSLYGQAIVLQWALAAWTLALWMSARRDLVTLGLVPRSALGLAIGLAVAVALGLGMWLIRARARRDPETLDRYLAKLRHLERMLPHTVGERRFFHLMSVTAGICEELLYRGYLLWYLGRWLDLIPAVVVASVVFGVGHAYQGWKGMLTTAIVGAFMAGVYLTSGSLWPAMLIHALTDMHAGSLAHAALERARAASLDVPASVPSPAPGA